jgi:hypothetical protein
VKQTYSIPVRLSDELMRKLLYVSEAEGRTPNNQFTFMLRNNIQYFEKVHGKISPATLAKYDLTPYAALADTEPKQSETEEPNQ